MLSSNVQFAGYANEKLNTSLTKLSIWTDKCIDPVVVDSVFTIGLDVGEGRGTNVGVGIGIAKGVAVVSRFGGSAMGVFNGATIAKGADVGVTMMDGSDESLQADMMAITIKIIGMTLVFRST